MHRIRFAIAPMLAGSAYLGYQAGQSTFKAPQMSMIPKMEMAEKQPAKVERTFIMVKPDGVARNLTGKIIDRFLQRGYYLVGMKLLVPSKKLAETHYEDLKSKPFYNGLVEYMTNGKAGVVAMVFEGTDAVKTGRTIIGATNPLESAPGTIRGDYCIEIGRNIIHGSDSEESANKEISLWFQPGELVETRHPMHEWVMGR
eukprot:NODE_277_length_10928_cov_0.583987.p8 type:complete len:200 gc:universal NODE_277_length_10928_cov_0.583987:6413-7012(+)